MATIHDWFAAHIGSEAGFSAVGHRVAHGGLTYSEPILIDRDVLAALEQLGPLAPLHQPHNIAAIRDGRHRIRRSAGGLFRYRLSPQRTAAGARICARAH
jgi:acetate kinase